MTRKIRDSTSFRGAVRLDKNISKTAPGMVSETFDISIPFGETTSQIEIDDFVEGSLIPILWAVSIDAPETGASTPTIDVDVDGNIELFRDLDVSQGAWYYSRFAPDGPATSINVTASSSDFSNGRFELTVLGLASDLDLFVEDSDVSSAAIFGEDYKYEESISASSTNVPYATTPTVKVLLTTDDLELGDYRITVAYGFTIDTVGKSFISAVELNNVEIGGRQDETVFMAPSMSYLSRHYNKTLSGINTIELLFGTSGAPAIATMQDASIEIFRVF